MGAMDLVLLPPGFVPFLDALAIEELEPSDSLQQFLDEISKVEGWLNFQRGFSVDEQEAGDLENLDYLVKGLRQTLESPNLSQRKKLLDKIVPEIYQTVGLMEKINAKRDKARYAEEPAINDLLLSGAAFLNGRGDLDAILDRVECCQVLYKNIRAQFQRSKQRLRPEVVESLQVGMTQLSQGLANCGDACESEDRTALQDSLADIKDAAEIVQHFIKWFRDDQIRLADQNQRFHIPIVGPILELNLNAAKEFDKSHWDRGIKSLYDDHLPRFFSFWLLSSKRIYVEPALRLELVESVELALEALRDALEALSAPETPPELSIPQFEESLELLSSAFKAIATAVPRTQHLAELPIGRYLGLFAAALEGQVPVVAFGELLHSHPPLPEWKRAIEMALNYCADGETEHLYQAIVELLKHAPPADVAAQPISKNQTWTCPTCHRANPVGSPRCTGCMQTSSYNSNSLFEA
jgi:hypothetical protein